MWRIEDFSHVSSGEILVNKFSVFQIFHCAVFHEKRLLHFFFPAQFSILQNFHVFLLNFDQFSGFLFVVARFNSVNFHFKSSALDQNLQNHIEHFPTEHCRLQMIEFRVHTKSRGEKNSFA